MSRSWPNDHNLNIQVPRLNINYTLNDYDDRVSINISWMHSKNQMALKLRQQKKCYVDFPYFTVTLLPFHQLSQLISLLDDIYL